jgi:hypothetical protein
MRRMSFVSGQEVSPISMNIGQMAYVCVYAHRLWNGSGVDVAAGQAYNLTVPDSEKWIDWRKKRGPDGYTSTFLLRPWEVSDASLRPIGSSLLERSAGLPGPR